MSAPLDDSSLVHPRPPRTHFHTPRAEASPEPVLDTDALQALRALGGDDDPSLFIEVIELYLDDARTHVTNLRAALSTGDLRLLERAAHTLKSSSANVGALAFSRLCLELEQAVRAERLQSTPGLVERAEREFQAVCEALEAAKG